MSDRRLVHAPPLAVETLKVGDLGFASGSDLAAPLPRASERTRNLYVNYGPPGTCPEVGEVEHRAVSDISGSLGGAGLTGNDPAGLRHAAILKAAEKIANVCDCGRESLQVLSFDLTSDLDVGPVKFNAAGLDQLRKSLSTTNVGWGISTLGPSLEAARAGLEDFDGKVTLTVLSDWMLTDTPGVIARLAEFPADSIHAIALTAPPPEAFNEYPAIKVTTAGWSDDPAVVAEAIYGEFTRFRPPAPPLPPKKSRRSRRRRRR